MAIKIKNILESIPKGGVLLGAWMTRQGLSRTEQVSYVRSGWLERIDRGVYKIADSEVKIYPALVSLSMQSDFQYHIGAFTALDLKGFSHFGQLGRPKVFVYAPKKKPDWISDYDNEIELVSKTNNKYEEIGITEYETDGLTLRISSPERAFFECLDMIPLEANPMDLYYIMEMLTTLRPRMLMRLLEHSSIKSRRLFLYMAKKASHPWYDNLELSRVNLGNGDRSISVGGVYDSEYKIVIPKELAQYE